LDEEKHQKPRVPVWLFLWCEAMKKPSRWVKLVSVSVLAIAMGGCETVQTTKPGTVGITRTQSMAVSAQQMNQSSEQSYRKMLQEAAKKNTLNQDAAMLARVRGIANKLIPQTSIFRSDASHWRWEVNVFQSDNVNAFCMAGGKIGFYSGLINKLELTDAEIAAVMGHEIAHALREHVREQVSLQYASQLPGVILSVVTGSQILSQLGDMVSNVTLSLPRSRLAESEADEIGVELAARAGFDPMAAVTLWQKMGRLGGSRPPEFMSTHPSPENRQQELTRVASAVTPLYQQAVKR
jgi:predicted Zn-dependent protease